MEHRERRLALIELLGRDGQVARTVDVWRWPLTLGRALDNDVVIDDLHVAAHHARLSPDADGTLLLQALPSRNGLRFAGLPVNAPTPLPAGGGLLQLGATRLRLRLPGETLAPETPLPRHAPGAPLPAPLLLGAAVFALLLGSHWLTLDPGAGYAAWLPVLVGLPAVLAAWCGLWALMSKLFQHRFDFNGHLRIALPWLLALGLADGLWPLFTAALALPGWWKLGPTIEGVLLALMVHAHLVHLLPLHRRAVAATVATLAVASAALSAAFTWRSTDSLVATPYMSTLPPPALRLAGTAPTAALVQDMAVLAEGLAARVQQAKADDEDEGEGNE
ncbi:MAG: FHA domain-containing protein [Rubrivivax sp.]|nr:FHA domain-containing protein [Rubrivivax sp.]